MVIDPETGEKTPYTKARGGEPVEGSRHHAEQRMERTAKDNGEKLRAQAPTKKCCAACRKTLGPDGLAKIPENRRGE